MSINYDNQFDDRLVIWMNSFAGYSDNLDRLVGLVSGNYLLQGAVIVCIFWWCWFRKSDPATTERTREHLLCTLIASVLAIVVARMLALTMPFRARPRFTEALHFVLPPYAQSTDFMQWSAFPSDHAVMFAALTVGIFYVSWRLGLVAAIHNVLVISLPRIYLGMHYPSDLLVGWGLGILIGYGMNRPFVRRHVAARMLRWEQLAPSPFYVVLFMLTYQFSTMFDSTRGLALAAARFAARMAAAL